MAYARAAGVVEEPEIALVEFPARSPREDGDYGLSVEPAVLAMSVSANEDRAAHAGIGRGVIYRVRLSPQHCAGGTVSVFQTVCSRPASAVSVFDSSSNRVEHHTWSYSNFREMRERLETLFANLPV